MTLAELALYLGVQPDNLDVLHEKMGLPFGAADERGNVATFDEVRSWRRRLEPTFIVFGSVDHRAQVLRDALAASGVDVEPLPCALCAKIASRQCEYCGSAVCFPHSSHFLKTGGLVKAHVVCDKCFHEHEPDCY